MQSEPKKTTKVLVHKTADATHIRALTEVLERVLKGLSRDILFEVSDNGFITFRNYGLLRVIPGASLILNEAGAIGAAKLWMKQFNEWRMGQREGFAGYPANAAANFPDFFHKRLEYRNAVPVYKEEGKHKILHYWKVIYGLSTAEGAAIADHTVTLHVRHSGGGLLVGLDYHALPLLGETEETESALPLTDEQLKKNLIYRHNSSLQMYLPYLITETGVVSLTRLGAGGNEGDKRKMTDFYIQMPSIVDSKECESFFTISEIVPPISGVAGKAKLTIKREFRIPSIGKYAIFRLGLIDEKVFSDMFKRGNIDIKTKLLPTQEFGLELLSKKEEKESRKIDSLTNKPLFWDYYDLAISYEISLSKEYTFLSLLEWLVDCKSTKGIIYEELNFDGTNDLIALKKMDTNSFVKKYSTQEEPITKENVSRIKIEKENLLAQQVQHNINKFVFLEYLKSHINELRGKRINAGISYIYKFDEAIKYFCEENSIEIVQPTSNLDTQNVLTIISLPMLYNIATLMSDWYINGAAVHFWEKNPYTKDEYNVGGVGKNKSSESLVVLNPFLFGRNSGLFSFGGMSPTEILVHEVGHNLAQIFVHKTGNYEYYQVGLQSNIPGQIHPTLQNTIDIINDVINRKTMQVI